MNSYLFRAAFARKMATIRKGMVGREVIAIIGHCDIPIAVQTQLLRYERYARNDAESARNCIWGYGVGNTGFPTLGQIWFDSKGEATHIFGAAEVANDLGGLDENSVRDALAVIDLTPSPNGWAFDPLCFLRVSQYLRRLESSYVFTLLREYFRVSPSIHCRTSSWAGLTIILRAIHDIPFETGLFQEPPLGGHWFHVDPMSQITDLAFPRFPLSMIGDVPFLLVGDYVLLGSLGIRQEVEAFRGMSKLSSGMNPTSTPHQALTELWKSLFRLPAFASNERLQAKVKVMLLNQLLRMVANVYPASELSMYNTDNSIIDGLWDQHLLQLSLSNLQWDESQGRYQLRV
jgi:hypothetical protein